MTAAGRRGIPTMAGVLDRYSALMREMKEYAYAEQAATEALGIRVRQAVQADSFR